MRCGSPQAAGVWIASKPRVAVRCCMCGRACWCAAVRGRSVRLKRTYVRHTTSPRGPSDGRTFGGGRIAGHGAISDGRPIPQTQPAARESRSVTGRLSSSEAVLEAFVSAPSTTRTNNQTNRKQGSQISATAQRALCASDQPVLHAPQLLSVQHITGK